MPLLSAASALSVVLVGVGVAVEVTAELLASLPPLVGLASVLPLESAESVGVAAADGTVSLAVSRAA